MSNQKRVSRFEMSSTVRISTYVNRTNTYQQKNDLPWLEELMGILSKVYMFASITCVRSCGVKLTLDFG